MGPIKEFLLPKLVRLAVDESYRSLVKYYIKAALGVLGVIFGTRLVWQWVKKWEKTVRLTRLRKKKQKERQQAMKKLEQLVKETEVSTAP